jgi:hypothetical protein
LYVDRYVAADIVIGQRKGYPIAFGWQRSQ